MRKSKLAIAFTLTLFALERVSFSGFEGPGCSEILISKKEFSKQITELLSTAIKQEGTTKESRELQKLLNLDDANYAGFMMLHKKYAGAAKKVGGNSGKIWIYEEGKVPEGDVVVYSAPNAPLELQGYLRIAQHAELLKEKGLYAPYAKKAVLLLKKMQAGTGSSFARLKYLLENLGREKLGAKGTDLLIEIEDPRNPDRTVEIPLVEAQILQAIQAGENYGGIILHDIVSSETDPYVQAIWNKPSLIDPSLTYEQLAKKMKGIFHKGKTIQAHIPTVDEDGNISFNRKAPSGHYLFFIDAMRGAFNPRLLPKTGGKDLITVISNGEDLSSNPDPTLVGWMVKKKIPIVLVTTDKSLVDVKGGVVGIAKPMNGRAPYLTVVETAQAKSSNQLALFERLEGFASTNLTLINYTALTDEIRLRGVSEKDFMEALAPNLIENLKEQTDEDGVKRKYLQLEGAMGSSLMNLDRFWREKFGEPLVHIVNIARTERTGFFAPIKSAFDYWMQFHSDRFKIDSAQVRLIDQRPGFLPVVSLKDPKSKDLFYQDVSHVMESFHKTRILKLDHLEVSGKVCLEGLELRGKVRITNLSDSEVPVRLGRLLKSRILENVDITLDTAGKLSLKNISE